MWENGVARSMNFRASFLRPEFSVSSSSYVTHWEKQGKLNVLRKIAPERDAKYEKKTEKRPAAIVNRTLSAYTYKKRW